jgi:hypothetical protein
VLVEVECTLTGTTFLASGLNSNGKADSNSERKTMFAGCPEAISYLILESASAAAEYAVALLLLMLSLYLRMQQKIATNANRNTTGMTTMRTILTVPRGPVNQP